MPDWIIKYVGGGISVVIIYIIVSNTLWLLLGSELLKLIPGVNFRGSKGTFKIAIMILMSIVGFIYWVISLPILAIRLKKPKGLLYCISSFIKYASKHITNRIDF